MRPSLAFSWLSLRIFAPVSFSNSAAAACMDSSHPLPHMSSVRVCPLYAPPAAPPAAGSLPPDAPATAAKANSPRTTRQARTRPVPLFTKELFISVSPFP